MRELEYVEGGAPHGHTEVGAESIRAALEKVLGSRTFTTAKNLRAFLGYAVLQALDGRSDLLKEYSIGIDVFGRSDRFDPRLDPIVRVHAWKLRARLAKYYETEGAQDALQIEFHKGSYAPRFTNAAARDAYAHSSPGASLPPPALSIAVLPFVARSENRADEAFCDSLTDEVISLLGRVPELRVAAQTSAFQFKQQTLDIRRIARTLNVRMVLEGSVRRYGRTRRITYQLVDASTGYQLCSDNHESETEDEQAIQREIAGRVARMLRAQFSRKSASPVPMLPDHGRRAADPLAYQQCVRGRHFASKETAGNLKRAIDCFERAIASDPRHAPAYSGLAYSYISIPNLTDIPTRDVVPKIRAAAYRALELDDTAGEAHMALASASAYAFDWSTADSEFQRGIALSADDTIAHWQYGTYLLKTGRFEEALTARKRAFELDPASPDMAQGVAMPLLALARDREAVQWFQTALDLDPHFGMACRGLAQVYIQQGLCEQGLAELKRAYQLMEADSFTTGELGYAYAVCGDKRAAENLLAELLRLGGPLVAIARVYIGLGETSRAFECLRSAIDQHEVYLVLHDSVYNPLRRDSRFTDLLRRMNLPLAAN